MARIVGVGGGVVGLVTAMLLARDGHDVTVLERDEAAAPDDPEEAWGDWARRGVNQFRQLHFFQPGFRVALADEIPELDPAFIDAGALRFSVLEAVPESISGGHQPGDDRFAALTGRRSVMEAVVARLAADTDGLEVRRGTAVTGLVATGPAGPAGPAPAAPHVTGVRLEGGDTLDADLVLDLGGRRSALPRWLEDIGAAPLHEAAEDSGFTYYGRHFRSADGTVPPILGPLLTPYGSVSVLTLPADHGTWGVGIVTLSDDAELRGLRQPDRFTAALRTFPLQAHWGEAEAIDDVATMTKIEDRRRELVVDGRPVATGVVSVGDAWACTNPSLGRGISIGTLQALALRDLLRDAGTTRGDPPPDPVSFSTAWHATTDERVGEWYESTRRFDRHRLAEATAAIDGTPYRSDDPGWQQIRALEHLAGGDPGLFRRFLSITHVLQPPSEVFSDPGVRHTVDAVGDAWKDQEVLGPSRRELADIASAA